ncbi:MAG: DUF3592 domain-containing protein [Planctomycetota bacterium]|jgi:hypothetical protein
MPETEAPAADPAENERGHWSGLLWIAAGAFAIKLLAFDMVGHDAFIKANWTAYEGTITASEVVFGGPQSGHEIHFTFTLELPDGTREYQGTKTQATGKDFGREVRGPYAVGNTLPVYVNPENESEYRRPENQAGLRRVGYLIGGVLSLIGLSVLRGKRSRPAPETDGA